MTETEETIRAAAALEASAGDTPTSRDLVRVYETRLAEVERSAPEARWLQWEVLVHSYELRLSGESEGHGPLSPMMEAGETSYPPPVIHFDEEAIPYLRQRAETARTPAGKARINDFLWLRTREIKYADQAIDAYVQGTLAFAEHGNRDEAVDHLNRAAFLGRQLKRRQAELATLVASMVQDVLASGTALGYACILVRDHAELLQHLDHPEDLLRRLIDEADRIAAEGGSGRHFERGLLEAAIGLAGAIGEREKRDALRERLPASLEGEADERLGDGGLVQSSLLQDALRLYSDLGMSADIPRVKRKIQEALSRGEADMKKVSDRLTVPDDSVSRDVDQLLKTQRQDVQWAHLINLGCQSALWPRWVEVEKRAAELRRQYPLKSLVARSVVGPDGSLYPAPTDPQAREEFEAVERFAQDLRISVTYLSLHVEELRKRGEWSASLLKQAFDAADLFDDAAINAVMNGVEMFEAENYLGAAHTLTPQVERVVRTLGRSLGVEVQRYNAGTGELRWASLEQMLNAPQIQNALNLVREDWAKELAYVLVDSRGWNQRNLVAHGLLPEDAQYKWDALLLLFILLCLAAIRLQPVTDGSPPEADF